MKTKHFILTLLALLTCISVSAYDDCIDGICYNLSMRFFNGKVEYIATVTYQNYDDEYNFPFSNYDGDITIPSTIVSKIEPTNHIETSYDNHYNVVAIGDEAFAHSSRLTSVTIPNSVTSIGKNAFADCSGLKSVTIPNSVTTIDSHAFCGCTGLESITIPSSVTSIGSRAFYHTGLSSITIPSSVENFNGGALTGCTELTSIIVESGNPVYDCRDNCNAIVESSTNTLIAGCKNTIIPNTVTQIGSEAFYDHNEITTIAIPSSVTSLGNQAFRGSGLTSINIPEGVTNIESWAFVECHDLTSVTVNNPNPISLSDDQDLGFDRYNAVLYVPAGCRDAYANANYWRDFKEVKEIGADVVFTANTPEGVEMTFKVISESEKTCMVGLEEDGVASITETYNGGITIPSVVNGYTVKRIGVSAFYNCSSLTSVNIPSSVTSIGWGAFDRCSGLTSVNIPEGVTIIGGLVFNGCSSLTSINIPSSVTSIGYYAFSYTGLTSITIPSSVTDIDRAFAACRDLTSIIVDINNPVFDSRNNCNAIIETSSNSLIAGCINTVIPETVTSIAAEAFRSQSLMTSISIPASVIRIDDCFSECHNLTSVTVNNPVPFSMAEETFIDRANITLYVPAGSKAEYEAADYWKDFKEIVEIDTDISQLDNAIYIEPFTARVGEDVRMSINLKNAEAATAYVFDLVLPEGITVATNDKGKYIDELSDRHDDHTRTINFKGENTYSLSTLSGNSEELTGNDGPIRFVTLHVDDAVEEGVYPILIKNASYSKPNGALVVLAATKSSVTIEDYVLGDVNGNGGVDIGDAVSIVNYLVGKESSNFVAKAADTNKNGQIDIGDAVTIVNLLVGKITSLTRELNINWDDKNPE